MGLSICPHCGYDLRADSEVIESGPWRYVPRDGLYHEGVRMKLNPRMLEIVAAVIRVAPRPVSFEALAERVGYEGDAPHNTFSVQLCLMGRVMRPIPRPVENVWGRGLRWIG